ncbi:hypothetical protein [Candidatus Avelusimicrobium fimicolum]|uniref:hypothetical protein n=1 Tax=Candidatus Avelusimicrobium fimicolum TaxID=3416216 RepID=UPI003D0F9F1D
MKKLLGLLLAMTMAWPVTASAEVLKNVDLKGEIQTIASDARHDKNAVYKSGTNFRVLAGLSADLVEDVRANVLFQYNDAWLSGTEGNTVQNYWDEVRLAEANVVLSNLFCCLEATVGRQFYGDEDSAVMYLGPNHYVFGMNNAPSLDGAKLVYSDDFKTFTMLAGKLVTYTTVPSPTGSSTVVDDNWTVYGLDLKLNLTDTLTAQVYGYDFMNSKYDAAREKRHNGFYGAKATFAPEAATLSAEYARGYEANRLFREGHNSPYMVKVDAALNMDVITPRAAFYYAKDVVSPFGNYYPGLAIGHVLAGDDTPFAEYSGDGVRMFNVGVDYVWNKFVFSLDGFSFQDRTAKDSSTWEADLVAKYNHNDYVQLFAGIGYAKYSTGVKEALDTKDNTVGQLGMLIKF